MFRTTLGPQQGSAYRAGPTIEAGLTSLSYTRLDNYVECLPESRRHQSILVAGGSRQPRQVRLPSRG
jgi:hypothetical protein